MVFSSGQEALYELDLYLKRERRIDTGSRMLRPYAEALEQAESLRFGVEMLLRLVRGLGKETRTQDADDVARIFAVLAREVRRRRDELEGGLLEALSGGFQAAELIKAAPHLIASAGLVDRLIDLVAGWGNGSPSPDWRMSGWERLAADEAHGRRLLRVVFENRQVLLLERTLEIVGHWSGGAPWGVMLSAMLGLPKTAASVDSWTPAEDLIRCARQLPMIAGSTDRELEILDSGPQQRATWRSRLANRLTADPVSAKAGLEALFWLGARGERVDDELNLLAVECGRSRVGRDALASLEGHPSLQVQIRAETALAALDGGREPLIAGPPPESLGLSVARITGSRAARAYPRTWLGDAELESWIEQAVDRAAAAAALEHEDHWREIEEVLVAQLFQNIQRNLSLVDREAERIARAAGAPRRMHIQSHYRLVPKTEEGQAGLDGAKRFSTDVCIIVNACRDGVSFARRATLVQAKKLSKSGTRWRPSYEVDPEQRADLIRQTRSAFYVFLGPPDHGRNIPCVPAELLADLDRRDGPKKSVAREAVAVSSKSLAEWLTYDVFGLWTGDRRPKLIRKAEGEPGRTPRILLTITLDQRRRSRG